MANKLQSNKFGETSIMKWAVGNLVWPCRDYTLAFNLVTSMLLLSILVLPQCHTGHAALYATRFHAVSYQQLLPDWPLEAAIATYQACCQSAALLAMLQSLTAAWSFTTAQLTLSTPPQMPQLLTDTDSLRLVPIVATCSVTHVSHCTAQLQCTSIQGHQEEEGSTGTRWEVESVSTGSQQGFDSELKGIPQAVNRELIGSQ